MEATLRQQAERYLGGTIYPCEWDNAKAYAERKLALIIERYGDEGGERREPYYLAQLIAEAVNADRLSMYLYLRNELQEDKKRTAPRRSARQSHHHPHCSMV